MLICLSSSRIVQCSFGTMKVINLCSLFWRNINILAIEGPDMFLLFSSQKNTILRSIVRLLVDGTIYTALHRPVLLFVPLSVNRRHPAPLSRRTVNTVKCQVKPVGLREHSTLAPPLRTNENSVIRNGDRRRR
ncbi:hypothetical protein B5X24_HaOG201965 [Helicoverpa armigera]|uniref:Uncharacterized protein n=1 Tax=Helicoverpa armigera TaxID=29058 RepID=A0A2W1C122_HELAM|nr:hypothetical protein B5X24_HaOG201965 [Helicoverpa armigera]